MQPMAVTSPHEKCRVESFEFDRKRRCSDGSDCICWRDPKVLQRKSVCPAERYRLVADEAEVGAEVYITEEEGLPYFTVEVDESLSTKPKRVLKLKSKRFTRSSSISTSAKPIAMRFWMQKTLTDLEKSIAQPLITSPSCWNVNRTNASMMTALRKSHLRLRNISTTHMGFLFVTPSLMGTRLSSIRILRRFEMSTQAVSREPAIRSVARSCLSRSFMVWR